MFKASPEDIVEHTLEFILLLVTGEVKTIYMYMYQSPKLEAIIGSDIC